MFGADRKILPSGSFVRHFSAKSGHAEWWPSGRIFYPHPHPWKILTILTITIILLAFQCQEGEFRWNNKRCLTKAVENSECDGIDWCMDNTGCDVNVSLIVGLCVAFGAVLFVLCIVICIVCCAKHKTNQVSCHYSPARKRVGRLSNLCKVDFFPVTHPDQVLRSHAISPEPSLKETTCTWNFWQRAI